MSERTRALVRPIVCLMGPTAAGKTAAAMALAQRMDTAVISVDSAMVYRRMDIGTGKPTVAELAKVPHALINIREPHETYSAAEFATDAAASLELAWSVGKTPVLVGGTSLYFRALLEGFSPLPAADAKIRAEVSGRLEQDGLAELHRWLSKLDPPTAARLHVHDSQRIQRALEVCLSSGRPMSDLFATRGNGIAATVLKFVVAPADRAVLHQRIAERFDTMLGDGLAAEVESLMAEPRITRELPAMRCVGYRQTWDTLTGVESMATLAERGKAATRQLARRQLTWLRKESGCHWVDPMRDGWINMIWQQVDQHGAGRTA